MDVQVEHLDTHEARLTITVPNEMVDRARRDVARKLSKDVRIPGFRPGNAPLNLVIATVGQQAFAAELANELAGKVYSQALEQAGIDPYSAGQLEDFKSDPTQLIVRVPLEPVVDLKDYRSVRLPAPVVEVSDEEIETQLQYLREDHAIVQAVERPAQLGDMVEAVIVGTVDGNQILSDKRRTILLDPERMGIPALVDPLIGMSAGEHKDCTITLPDDFEEEFLRGKEVQLSIDVHRVSSRTLPEINDELAQTVGQFQTLTELREDVRRRLLERKQRQADQEYAAQVLDAFTNLSTISYPPAFIEDRLADALADFKEDVKRSDGLPFEEWLKLENKTEEQVKEELRPQTEARARRGLVMREFARAEKIAVSDTEIAAEVERQMQVFGVDNKQIRRFLQDKQRVRSLESDILSNKIMRRMVEIAKGLADGQSNPQVEAVEATG
ncbi:MAG: trigger factor [Anaerolineae bacterium]|nr:trigger factor [Thermoflexales bacterium]MDW8406422.1 trigger factor [Anaerolineae bacterium]